MQNNLQYISLVFITVVLLSSGYSSSQKSVIDTVVRNAANSHSQTSTMADKVIVYYFHTEYRCWSCNQFEELTREVIEESFPEQLKNGTIEFKSINIETEDGKHFVDDYQLVTKSVILSLRKGEGQRDWKNMDKIWMLVRNTEKFKSYIEDGIRSYVNQVRKL